MVCQRLHLRLAEAHVGVQRALRPFFFFFFFFFPPPPGAPWHAWPGTLGRADDVSALREFGLLTWDEASLPLLAGHLPFSIQ